MTPEIALAFVLGLIGGVFLAIIVIWSLAKKLIRVGIMKKSDTDDFSGDNQ